MTNELNLMGHLKDQCQEVQKTNPELFTCRWLWKSANVEFSSNVLIFIQFLKEYYYVKYCQITFCMFLLLMINYKKDCNLEKKYFNAFCWEKNVLIGYCWSEMLVKDRSEARISFQNLMKGFSLLIVIVGMS